MSDSGGFEAVDLSILSPTGQTLEPDFVPEPVPDTETDPQPDPTPEPEVEPEVEPEAEPEPVDPSATFELPDGSTITLERARQLAAMELAFRTTPDAERRVAEALRPPSLAGGEPQAAPGLPSVPAPAAVNPPPELDLEDPAVRYLWSQHQETAGQIAALRDTIAKQNEQQSLIQQQQVATGYASARNNMAQRYGLNPDELAHVEATAARVANLQGLINEEGGSIERAAVRAMEIAIASDPQMRSRLVQPKDTAADKARKTKLSALAGTSGSAPRTEPATPLTREQKVEAMAAEFQRAATGTQV